MVKVKLYGTLRRFSQKDTPGIWVGEPPLNSTVTDLIGIIGSKPNEVAVASINGEVCPFDTVVPDGAEVMLATHIGAG